VTIDTSRAAAAIVLVVLLYALIVGVATSTPWRVVPGGWPRRAPWQRDFTADERKREVKYHREVRPPLYARMVLGLLVALVLGLTPLGARLVEWVSSPAGDGWVWWVLLGGLAVALVSRLVTLPLSAWSELVLRRWGLSTRTWGSWAADLGKGFGVSLVLTLLPLLAFFWLTRQFPETWWIWAAAGAAAFVILVSFAYPLVIEPVFNKFASLPAGVLRTALLELAARDQVHVKDVLVADASRRTTALNAYVSGLGATRRIVVFDTLLDRAGSAEVESVVAHELGHTKHRDVLRGTLIGALGSAAAVCLLFLVLQWQPLLDQAGTMSAADPTALPLVLALLALMGAIGTPLANLVSRRIEARADVHALELTGDPTTFAQMERQLALANIADLKPHPLVIVLFATHPSAPQRLALARSWARSRRVPEHRDLVA
jgi:STE24 endopeptidase